MKHIYKIKEIMKPCLWLFNLYQHSDLATFSLFEESLKLPKKAMKLCFIICYQIFSNYINIQTWLLFLKFYLRRVWLLCFVRNWNYLLKYLLSHTWSSLSNEKLGYLVFCKLHGCNHKYLILSKIVDDVNWHSPFTALMCIFSLHWCSRS